MNEASMKAIGSVILSTAVILIVSATIIASAIKIKKKENKYTLDIGICDEAIDLGRHTYLVKCNNTFDVRHFKLENNTLKPSIKGINLSQEQYVKFCDMACGLYKK